MIAQINSKNQQAQNRNQSATGTQADIDRIKEVFKRIHPHLPKNSPLPAEFDAEMAKIQSKGSFEEKIL